MCFLEFWTASDLGQLVIRDWPPFTAALVSKATSSLYTSIQTRYHKGNAVACVSSLPYTTPG